MIYIVVTLAVLGYLLIAPAFENDDNRFSESEKEWLAEHSDQVFYMGYYTSLSEKWFSRKLAEAFSNDTGLTFELYEGTWEETLQKLKNGEISVCANLNYSEERSRHVIYTSSFEGIDSGLYSKMDANIDSIEGMKGKRIGLLKGSYLEEVFKERYPNVEFEYDYYETNEMLSKALNNHEIHGFISTKNYNSNMREFYYYNISTLKNDNNFVGINKDYYELAGIIKKEVDYLRETNWSKYIKKAIDFELEKEYMPFNEEELSYIEQSHTIRVGIQRDFYYSEMMPEILRRIGIRSELDIDLVIGNLDDLMMEETVDIVVTYDDDNEKLNYSMPLLVASNTILGRDYSEAISENYDLESYEVGVHTDAIYGHKLYEEMPYIGLKKYADVEQMIDGLVEGELDYMIIPEGIESKLLSYDETLSNKGMIDENVFYLGMKVEDRLLVNIINKSILKIDINSILEGEANLFLEGRSEGFKYEEYILVVIGIIILLALLGPAVLLQRNKIKNILYTNRHTKLENLYWLSRNMKKYNEDCIFYIVDVNNMDRIHKYYEKKTYRSMANRILNIYRLKTNEDEKIIYLDQDKYLVVKRGLNPDEMVQFAEGLATLFKEKIYLFDLAYAFSANIGYYNLREKSNDLDGIMKSLEAALDYARAQNICVEYNLDIESKLDFSYNMDKEIIDAIMNEDVVVLYDEITSKNSDELVAYEAVLKCKNAQGEYFNNKSFSNGVKQFNLEKEVDQLSLKKIVEHMKTPEIKGTGVSVLTHVSMGILLDENFGEWYTELTKEIVFGKIIFKISNKDFDHNFERLFELESSRIGFAIDRFGEDLTEIFDYSGDVVEMLCMDARYLDNLSDDSMYEDVLDFVINLGVTLEKKILVSGIKTKSQYEIVKSKEVAYLSGPYMKRK